MAHRGHYSDTASGRGESLGPHQTDLLLSAGETLTRVSWECWLPFSGALVPCVIVISIMMFPHRELFLWMDSVILIVVGTLKTEAVVMLWIELK